MNARILPIALCILAAPSLTVLPGQDAKAASSLRDASATAFKAKQYREAIDKLQAALAIYESLGGHLDEKAICLRAITWNEHHDGKPMAALTSFEALAELAAGKESIHHELKNGWNAVSQSIYGLADLDAQVNTFAGMAKTLKRHHHDILAAQATHNLAGVHGKQGNHKAMANAFARAIAIRKRLGDHDGVGWSQNNTAYHYLQAEMLREALPPLEAAAELVASGKVTACQQAVATNLATAIALAAKNKPSRRTLSALWRLAKRAGASDRPFAFTPDRLVRAALATDIARNGDKGGTIASRQAMAIARSSDWPNEVSADITLLAAHAALHARKPRIASKLIAELECGRGPCAPHLTARRQVVEAMIAGAKGNARGYDTAAKAAILGMQTLADRRGYWQALEALTLVPVDGSKQQPQLAKSLVALRSSGGPGGNGGSARSNKVGRIPADAGDHLPIFEVRWNAERETIEIEDLIGGSTWNRKPTWKPNCVSFNGVGIEFFGGYIRVRSCNYGGVAVSGGARGETTLDQLGNYVPVTTSGSWQITKNGALRHRAQQ